MSLQERVYKTEFGNPYPVHLWKDISRTFDASNLFMSELKYLLTKQKLGMHNGMNIPSLWSFFYLLDYHRKEEPFVPASNLLWTTIVKQKDSSSKGEVCMKFLKYFFIIVLLLLFSGCMHRYPHNLDLNNPNQSELVEFFNKLTAPESRMLDYLSDNAEIQLPDYDLNIKRDKTYYTKQQYIQYIAQRRKVNQEKIGRRFGKWDLVGITTDGNKATLYTTLDVFRKNKLGQEHGGRNYTILDLIKENGQWKIVRYTVDYNSKKIY